MDNTDNLITTQIHGIKFRYNKDRYYEKNGHIYCKTCHDRIDSKPYVMLNKGYIFTMSCKCDKKRQEEEKQREIQIKRDKLRENCFISRNQIAYTFENIDDCTDKEIIIKAKNYVKNFEKLRKENMGLLLYGNVGSGKTYIACSIANEIISEYGYPVKMRNLSQILNDLQKSGLNQDRNRYIEEITNPTLLIIDDFGIERNTEYALEQIYNVINSRYLKGKPTIITTNLNYKDIETEQSDVMLNRIYSRIIEMCLPLRIVGTDKRKRNSKEKMIKAQKLING